MSSFKKQKISLIIPAFKQEKTIVTSVKKTIKAMQQLRLPFEIIVVIDGRLDKTYEKIKKYSSRKIKVFQ